MQRLRCAAPPLRETHVIPAIPDPAGPIAEELTLQRSYAECSWLGHESPTTTHQYVEANLAMKEKALAKLEDPNIKVQRYRVHENLIEFLNRL